MALHNGKKINASRRANDPKYICTQNRRTHVIRQILNNLQRNLDSHTIIVGDFNTPLSILDRSRRQKINKDIQDLNSDLDKADLINVYGNLHPKATEYILLSTTLYLV